MSFITRLFRTKSPARAAAAAPTVTIPSVTDESTATTKTSAVQKTKRGARLALFATQGGAFGVTGSTPTARRKLLGN